MAERVSNLMWPPPIFISFTVVWFLNVCLAVVVVKQARMIRRINSERMTANEIELLQNGIAEQLAQLLMRTPIDSHGSPEWMQRYEPLVALGRKLGMQL